MTLVIAAHDEAADIAAKVANALALDYPRERLQLIVASDGSTDETVERARGAGADLVLDLPRGGKVAAQNAAFEHATGELVAFSDANSVWRPDALRVLAAAFGDERVGYAVGQVRLQAEDGASSQEGVYWRYEMGIRALESRLGGVTSGNGAIYAVRRESFVRVDDRMGHDLSLPFKLVKAGWRAVYVSEAVADEKMIPSTRGRVPAQAADGQLRLADHRPGRHALPARLHTALRLPDRSPTACCATSPPSCISSLSAPTSHCWAKAGSTP